MNTPPATPPEDAVASESFYTVAETSALRLLLDRADEQKKVIDAERPLRDDIWQSIQQNLRIQWTYDSNAIEGSTLSRGETAFFLQEGLTVEGKPLKDYLDARNHAEAIDALHEIVEDRRPISEGLIRELNALLLSGVTHTQAVNEFGQKVRKPASPGQYKTRPNHVRKLDGSLHFYAEPLQVPGEMERLVKWVEVNINTQHPAVTGAVAHYNMVRIHPFDDGNGRGARLLMNLILMKRGYPPAIVRMEQRRRYLQTLDQADKGDLAPFTEFIAESLIATQDRIVADLACRP
ncbi:MAG: Fic family protein [Pseudomonadota bacterium]